MLLDTNFFWDGETEFPDDTLNRIKYVILAPVNFIFWIIP